MEDDTITINLDDTYGTTTTYWAGDSITDVVYSGSNDGTFTIDTSTTPLYVIPPITSINDMIPHINKAPSYYIYDVLGSRYDNINNIPTGSMYIRDGKKYIRK